MFEFTTSDLCFQIEEWYIWGCYELGFGFWITY